MHLNRKQRGNLRVALPPGYRQQLRDYSLLISRIQQEMEPLDFDKVFRTKTYRSLGLLRCEGLNYPDAMNKTGTKRGALNLASRFARWASGSCPAIFEVEGIPHVHGLFKALHLEGQTNEALGILVNGSDITLARLPMINLMPIFANSYKAEGVRVRKKILELNALNPDRVPVLGRLIADHRDMFTSVVPSPSEEPISELDALDELEQTYPWDMDSSASQEPLEGYWKIESAQENEQTNNTTEDKTKEKEPMLNKTRKIAKDTMAANKNAVVDITYLTAGRTSNKVVKEALRPLIQAAFKPSFMQRVLLKVTKAPNPIDVFLDTPYADLLCAQLAQVLIDVKGVEDEKVREAAQAGITYAGLEISKKVPIEATLDTVVAKLSEAGNGLVDKMKNK